jgi:hypothetical protein
MSLLDLFDGKPKKLLIKDSQNSIIEFDAVISESHSLRTNLTRHPIENGSTITDHAIREPITFKIKGIKSDHPISISTSLLNTAAGIPGNIISKGTNTFGGNIVGSAVSAIGISALNQYLSPDKKNGTPSQAFWKILKALRDDSTVVDIETALDTYKNMVVTSVETEKNSSNRQSLDVSVTFEEVVIVESKKVGINQFNIDPFGNVTGNGGGGVVSGSGAGDGKAPGDGETLGGATSVQNGGSVQTKPARSSSILRKAFDTLAGK